jgi:hypothetical protein
MTPSEKQEFERLKKEVSDLKAWKVSQERNQLQSPLDTTSVKVLSEILKNTLLEQIRTNGIIFDSRKTTNPTREGELTYVSGTLRVRLNGVNRTITTT